MGIKKEDSNTSILINLDKKVDTIREDISKIKVTSAIQQTQLAEHMRRTELNEERLSLVEEKALTALESYKFVKKAIQIIAAIATFVLTIFGIYHEYFK